MSFEHTTCGKCFHTQGFYGRYVPPCPKCGYPELKTSEEYCRAMGVPYQGTYVSDEQRLSTPMGQFQAWYGKLFYWFDERLGWRYLKGVQV